MYNIGEKIVYPMHGAGTIEKIEEKTILGELRKYYVLKLPCGDMKVMIPIDKIEEIGVRQVILPNQVDDVFGILKAPSSKMPGNWNRRYRENMEKLKTGDIGEVAEVVRNLIRVEREKHLSTGEKKLLSNARQILISEIILANNMKPGEVDDLIGDAV